MEACRVGDWLLHHGLPRTLLPLLEAHGAERAEDLAYLERCEIDQICKDSELDIAEQSKLRQVLRLLRIAEGMEEDAATQKPAAHSTARTPPRAERLTPAVLEQHLVTLQRYASSATAAADTVASLVHSLHLGWASCVADPTLRPHVLPVLFAIAKRSNAGAVEREAALALVFLSFSLSGTVIKTDLPLAQDSRSTPCKHVVIIMGWLGSANDEFETVAQHYRTMCPGCKVLTTVGGSDRWADVDTAAQETPSTEDPMRPRQPCLFSDGSTDAPWPTSALCEEQLWHLAEAMLPPLSLDSGDRALAGAPRVFFHCFSNGFTLYIRLLRHLWRRGKAGEVDCADALARISGVIFDSTPAWGPPPAVIPPPPIVKLVATQAVAAVLKKESISCGGVTPNVAMTIRDIGPNTPLKTVVESTCAHCQDFAFDSTWHYDWARKHEPPIPALFVYSAVDRTTRQEAIEQWLVGNKESWEKRNRKVRRLLLKNTSHCMHWFKARVQYEVAIAELIEDSGWLG